MLTRSRDELQPSRGRHTIACVGIQRRLCGRRRNTWLSTMFDRLSGAGRIEERVEASCLNHGARVRPRRETYRSRWR